MLLALCLGTAAQALTAVDYQAVKGTLTLATLPDGGKVADYALANPGAVLELEGSVTGIFSDINGSGLLLRLPDGQSALLMARGNDIDLNVGVTLRTLARAVANTPMLDVVALTRVGEQEDEEVDPANFTIITNVGAAAIPNRVDTALAGRPANAADPLLRPTVPTITVPVVPAPAPAPTVPFYKRPEVLQAYSDKILEYNAKLGAAGALHIAAHLLEESARYGVDPRLVFALVRYESCFNPRAVSRSGAQGLGQLMPKTAIGLAVYDSFDVGQNLNGTVHYLSGQLTRFGHVSYALAAYNAGPGAVKRYGGVPPYAETQAYVRNIWSLYCQLAGLDPDTGDEI
jgi:soluble lytic murein transglycosylase-like protein